jgi:GNAT superfamily N-acetyltransferase
MITILRTNSTNQDFINLVNQLDAELAAIDGEDHSFYDQFNKLDSIKHVVLVYENDKPISCGSVKEFAPGTMEVKRMYTIPEYRGKGIATKVLLELEKWTGELFYTKCILETGKRQPDAIRLYEKNGFTVIPNFGCYADDENSVCFEKNISL